MAIASVYTTIFTHLLFVREGTAFTNPDPANPVQAAGTVHAQAKPAANDTAWLEAYLGDCEEFKITPESETVDIRGGVPGGLVRKDVLEISRMLSFTVNVQLFHPAILQAIFGTGTLTSASTQANPLEAPMVLKGWAKAQGYDVQSQARIYLDLWCSMRVTDIEPWSGANKFSASCEFQSLHSPLNTISFPNPA